VIMNINFRYYLRRRRKLVIFSIFVLIIVIWCVYVISEKKHPGYKVYTEDEFRIKEENSTSFDKMRIVKRSVPHPNDRVLRVKEVCKKYSLGRYETQEAKRSGGYVSWVINNDHNVAYAPIQNTGVSFWLYMFVLLGGLSHDQIDFLSNYKLEDLVVKLSPKLDVPLHEALENSFKFTCVRHPFHRLAWIYHDQIKYYYTPNSQNNRTADSEETQVKIPEDEKLNPTDAPNFEKFITSIVDTPEENLNRILQPYHVQLAFCDVFYDYIATAETLYDDLVFMSKKVPGLRKLVTPEMKIKGVKSARDSVLVNKYLSTLSGPVFKKLYELYKVDFEMFDYDPVVQYTP